MSSPSHTDLDIRPLERRRTRILPPINASAEFILSSVPLAENARYDAEYDRFVSVEEATCHEDTIIAIWKDTELEKSKLFGAMNLLQQKLQPKQSTVVSTDVDHGSFTWKQVITEIQTASDSYKKTIFARMCEKSEVFEHWLSLLPTGDYTATISGAFMMGVKAARNIGGTQRTIYEALASIPDTLSHASAYVEIYKAHSSDTLVAKTARLCKDILYVLRLIVEFFTKSSWRRGTAALVKGGAYQQELADAILQMKTQALCLREEANLCLQKRIAEMDRKLDVRASREQSRHQLAKEELLFAIDSSTEITAQKVCTYLMRQLQANPDFSVRTGGLINWSISRINVTDSEGSLSHTPSNLNEGVTVRALLKALDADNGSCQDDVEYCLTLGFTQTEIFQNRAAWVLQTSELSEFVAGQTRSKLLTVNGNYDAAQFISPLSYVCAKLSDLISVTEQIYVATYFCSRHTDEWRESRANAVGLLAGLTSQLLVQLKKKKHINFQLNLSTLSEDIYGAVQAGNLNAVFDIFQTVVKQLPKGTVVFCIIDSISAYENSSRRQDTISLMQKMIKLIKRLKDVSLRCMVTFPGRGGFVNEWGLKSTEPRTATLEVAEGLL